MGSPRQRTRGSTAYGLLLAFGAVGGVVAGTSCAALTRRIGAQRLLATTVVVMACAQLALGLTGGLLVSSAALVCSSGAFAVFNATSRSMRQRLTPPHLLDRVNSTYLTVGRSAGALGALTGGPLAAAIGIQAPILAGVLLTRGRSADSPPRPVRPRAPRRVGGRWR